MALGAGLFSALSATVGAKLIEMAYILYGISRPLYNISSGRGEKKEAADQQPTSNLRSHMKEPQACETSDRTTSRGDENEGMSQ